MDTIVVAQLGEVYRLMREATTTHAALVRSPHPVEGDRLKKVTNLGWLLRNWRSIHDLHVSTERRMVRYNNVHPYEAVLAVRMTNGAVYATGWMDVGLLAKWLMRPVLRGRPVYWNHNLYAIGSDSYRLAFSIVNVSQITNPKELS